MTTRTRAEVAIHRHLLELPEVSAAASFLAYAPIRGEADITPVAIALRDRGALVAYPRVDDDGELSVRPHRAGAEMQPGFAGIPEPDSEPVPWSSIEVAFIPGVAFDRRGRRLGYGGGYFDRALAGFDGLVVGVAFERQVLDEVPAGDHDLSVAIVVTETGVIRPA